MSFFPTKLMLSVIGIVLCYGHQACCLLYYFRKINISIRLCQFNFWNFTLLFPDVVVVSDLNKNIGRSTDLVKKRHGSQFQDRIGIWSTWRKTSRSRVENQQQTQPTFGARFRNKTRDTLVVGERFHHCPIPVHQQQFYSELQKKQCLNWVWFICIWHTCNVKPDVDIKFQVTNQVTASL